MDSESTLKQTRFQTKIGRIKCETGRTVPNRKFAAISQVQKGKKLNLKRSHL